MLGDAIGHSMKCGEKVILSVYNSQTMISPSKVPLRNAITELKSHFKIPSLSSQTISLGWGDAIGHHEVRKKSF